MVDLSRIGERDRLKPRPGDEPHWQRLRAGCYVGFRPSKKGGKGTWFARGYDEAEGKYSRKALGDYGDLAGNDVFAAARKDAETWAEEVETGGIRPANLATVEDACREYLKVKPGPIAEGVFRRHVYSDPIAKVKLDKLRRKHLRDWRRRLEDAPALVSRSKQGEKRTKRRSASTVNRDMVPLRAALGRVLPLGKPETEAAWQEALTPIRGAGNRRTLYLDRAERKRLLNAVAVDAHPFVEAMCRLPLRPGAIAALQVGNFDERTRTLTIGKDKNGNPRQVAVPDGTSAFLMQQVKGKSSGARLFTRGDGEAWTKDRWKRPMKDAVAAAKLPAVVSAYTLRHSVITDLVLAGVTVFVVAKLAGTSVQMIEEHYGHLIRSAAEEALATLTL